MQMFCHQEGFLSRLGSAVLGCFSASIFYSFSQTPVQAFLLTDRTSLYEINFTDPTFADAIATYTAVTLGATTVGEEFSFEIEVKPYFQNYEFMLYNLELLPGGQSKLNAAIYNVRSLSPESGYAWSYQTPAASPPAGFDESWIQRRPDGEGGWFLEFLGGGSSSEALTKPNYELLVTIPGAWSCDGIGIGVGKIDCQGIEPGYTILENFVYDVTTNQTRFYAIDQDWDGLSPQLRFSLRSPRPVQAVPEPTTLVGALVAVGGWIAARRKFFTS
jgi:hypothetical protein